MFAMFGRHCSPALLFNKPLTKRSQVRRSIGSGGTFGPPQRKRQRTSGAHQEPGCRLWDRGGGPEREGVIPLVREVVQRIRRSLDQRYFVAFAFDDKNVVNGPTPAVQVTCSDLAMSRRLQAEYRANIGVRQTGPSRTVTTSRLKRSYLARLLRPRSGVCGASPSASACVLLASGGAPSDNMSVRLRNT
jgi:hypothetical protein